MDIGRVEGCDGPDEELHSVEDTPPGEDGYDSGGEGGILDPPAPRIGILVGLVVFSPNAFGSRPVPCSCSRISKKSRGGLSGLPSCLIRHYVFL
jgi:hypothetical protein